MRLYGVKIYKSGVLDRNFVPCIKNGAAGLYETCQNRFFPLTGGKVRGATLAGQEFQLAPQPARLTYTRNTSTLTCVAAGAQSYEWYEDDKLLPETSDSLSLTWVGRKPHVRTYKVVPVYTVFNETVKGDPATARVEYTPAGTVVMIR